MERYAEAFVAFGGMAGLGALIDIVLYRDRKRIEKWLVAGWVWFEDVKLSNFGWKEAKAARMILDKVAGRRFVSVRRLWFTLACTFLCSLIACVWTFYIAVYGVFASYREQGLPPPDTISAFLQEWNKRPFETGLVIEGLSHYVLLAVAFALAVGVARWLCQIVVRLKPGKACGFGLFTTIAVTHVLLLIFWSVTALPSILWHGPTLVISQFPAPPPRPPPPPDYSPAPSPPPPPDYSPAPSPPPPPPNESFPATLRDLYVWLYISVDYFVRSLAFQERIDISGVSMTALGKFAVLMALLSNVPRILFSVLFLTSYAFRPIIRPLVSRFWEGVIELKLATFTKLFAAMGALYAAGAIFFQ